MRAIATGRDAVRQAGGAIWLISISGAFAIGSLIAIGTTAARLVLIPAIAIVAALVACGFFVIRAAAGRPADAPGSQEKGVDRRFFWVVGLEVLTISVVNAWAANTGRTARIPALDLIIVGVHFLPLASMLHRPRYYPMGVLFCAVAIATLLWVPQDFRVGGAPGWFVLPSLGCSLVAAATGSLGLRDAWRAAKAVEHRRR